MIPFFRWLLHRFSRKIQVRLTVYFLIILLPLVAVSLFAVGKSRSIVYDQAVEQNRLALASVMDHIDLTLQNVEEISTLIATDAGLVEMLNKNGSSLSPDMIVDFAQLLKQLSNIGAVNHYLSQISVYHHASDMMISTDIGGRRLASEPHRDWFGRFAATVGTGIRYVMPDERVARNETFGQMLDTDSVTLVRMMDLYNTDRQPNVLLITLNKMKLLQAIKMLLPSPKAGIYLRDGQGRLIAGTSGMDGISAVPQPSASELEVTIGSGYSGWQLTLMQPKRELYEETDQLRMFTVVIIAVSILLAVGISLLVYRSIAYPVHKLTRGMKQFGEGQLNVRLNNGRKDEFGFLIDSFNRMADMQKRLIEDHYEQQLRVARTELQLLQSQINPHFLYNTLDSIYWSAKNYEADEIGEMVMNLSKFFRLSLNKGRQSFSLEESVSHLHYYIRIQQIRFLDSFTVEYRLDEASKSVPILKLLLQPLVENAILHGLEGKEEGGRLIISSWIEERRTVKISVRDNGKGMSEERLQYVQSELQLIARAHAPIVSADGEDWKDLFGLRNVLTRLKLYYGSEAAMMIESRLGEGTIVTLAIPLERCRDNPASDANVPADRGKGERTA